MTYQQSHVFTAYSVDPRHYLQSPTQHHAASSTYTHQIGTHTNATSQHRYPNQIPWMTAIVIPLPFSHSPSPLSSSSSSSRSQSVTMDGRSSIQSSGSYDYRPASSLSRTASPFAPAVQPPKSSQSVAPGQHQRHLRRASSDNNLERPHMRQRSFSGNAEGVPELKRRSGDVSQPILPYQVNGFPNYFDPSQSPWTSPMPFQAFYDLSPMMHHQSFVGGGGGGGGGGLPFDARLPNPSSHPSSFPYQNGGGQISLSQMTAQEAHAHAQVQANFAAWAAAYQGIAMAAGGGAQLSHPQQMMQPVTGPLQHDDRSRHPAPRQPQRQSSAPSHIPTTRSTSASGTSISSTSSSIAAAASTGPFHPYRRGPSSGKQRDRERETSVSSVSSSASGKGVSDGMSFNPGGPKQVITQSSVQNGNWQGASEELNDGDGMDEAQVQIPRHPYTNGSSSNGSKESLRSQTSSRNENLPTQRPRMNSTSSVTSNTRPGRVPVPAFISGSILPSAKEPAMGMEDGARSVGHSRQSSSMSSAGAVIKPKLSTTPSSTSTITQSTLQATSLQSPSASSFPSVTTPPLTSATTAASPPSTPTREWHPSTVSQTQMAPIVSPERPSRSSVSDLRAFEDQDAKADKGKGGGLKGRLQRALKKDTDKEEKSKVVSNPIITTRVRSEVTVLPADSSFPPPLPPKAGMGTSTSLPTLQSNPLRYNSDTSEESTASSAMPGTPPNPPIALPHTLGQRRPSNSSFAPSLIEPLDGKAKGKGRSLFNLRNASTDNISISSTVSSASMMIRRMGSLGKLARRNSLASISKIFKDKSKDTEDATPTDSIDANGKKSKKDKKRGIFSSKSGPAASSTSHATAQGDDRAVGGLTPAAQLARQHTLRSKAEEKSRNLQGQQQQEKFANAPEDTSTSWDNDASARPGGHGSAALPALGSTIPPEAFASTVGGLYRADSPDGDSFDVSHDIDDSEDEYDHQNGTVDDVTLRMGDASFGDDSRSSYESSEGYSWGQTYRDKHAIPARGILKATSSYGSDIHFQAPPAPWQRSRANSADVAATSQEPGPLSRVPAQDPDNIDGVKQEKDYDPFSPTFSPFENPAPQMEREPLAERVNFPYANAAHNTSAPALSNALSGGKSGKSTRAVTAPVRVRKNLIWSPECAVYHTFHASEYDRRSEPATCNRLTPQLAQQIKDELNGYKMEEMDVHPSSRVHTHFFV